MKKGSNTKSNRLVHRYQSIHTQNQTHTYGDWWCQYDVAVTELASLSPNGNAIQRHHNTEAANSIINGIEAATVCHLTGCHVMRAPTPSQTLLPQLWREPTRECRKLRRYYSSVLFSKFRNFDLFSLNNKLCLSIIFLIIIFSYFN